MIPGVPFISMGMEAFNDTPVVNGTAYPTLTVEPKSYRLRILNAANDRFWNLQFYMADATGTEVALNAAEVQAAQRIPTGVFPTPTATPRARSGSRSARRAVSFRPQWSSRPSRSPG